MEVKPAREKSENVTGREQLGAGCEDRQRERETAEWLKCVVTANVVGRAHGN